MVEPAVVGRDVSAAVGDADFDARILFQIAVKHQVTDSHGRIQRVADGVTEIVIVHPVLKRGADGMHEDHRVQFFDPGEKLLQPGAGQFLTGHVGGNLHPLEAQLVDAAFQLGNGHVAVLQRHGAQPDEAVRVLPDNFGDPVIDHLGRVPGEFRRIAVIVVEGRRGNGLHVDSLLIHIGEAHGGIGQLRQDALLLLLVDLGGDRVGVHHQPAGVFRG